MHCSILFSRRSIRVDVLKKITIQEHTSKTPKNVGNRLQYAVSTTRVASQFSTVFRFTAKAIEQLDCSRKLCGMSGFRPTAKLVLYRYAKSALSNYVLCSEAILIVEAGIGGRKTVSYTIAQPKTWAQTPTDPPDYYTVLTLSVRFNN